MTLREICRMSHLPDRNTVMAWRQADTDFHRRITDARARGCDALAEQSVEISDEADNDLLTDKDGRQYPNTAAIARAKLRVDTRLKIAALWNPKEYGAKQGDTNVNISLENLVLAAVQLREAHTGAPAPLNVTPARQALDAPSDGFDDLL